MNYTFIRIEYCKITVPNRYRLLKNHITCACIAVQRKPNKGAAAFVKLKTRAHSMFAIRPWGINFHNGYPQATPQYPCFFQSRLLYDDGTPCDWRLSF